MLRTRMLSMSKQWLAPNSCSKHLTAICDAAEQFQQLESFLKQTFKSKCCRARRIYRKLSLAARFTRSLKISHDSAPSCTRVKRALKGTSTAGQKPTGLIILRSNTFAPLSCWSTAGVLAAPINHYWHATLQRKIKIIWYSQAELAIDALKAPILQWQVYWRSDPCVLKRDFFTESSSQH